MIRAAILVLAVTHAVYGQTNSAVDYLVTEVPRWERENHCFSCHNNGDGARVLYAASRLGYAVPDSALAATTKWLLNPAKWDDL